MLLILDANAEGGLSTLDWPYGTAWMNERVQAFYGHSPKFTESVDEIWHTHAGLCAVTEADGTPALHQHTTFLECQQYENIAPDPIAVNPETGEPIMGNLWVNMWMGHLWMFNLNPEGIFAGTHPHVDPDAIPESSINDGREVPMFFMMNHGEH
ncbi:MAG: hypothetical protein HRU20_15785 [Pseudomonadales bacterium]|nr:hypothetical protein [Pseudomonadales bacterium]